MSEYFIKKVADYWLIKKRLRQSCFPLDCVKYFKNIYFEEPLQVAVNNGHLESRQSRHRHRHWHQHRHRHSKNFILSYEFIFLFIFFFLKTKIFMSNTHQCSFLCLDISADLLFLSLECHFFLLLVFF